MKKLPFLSVCLGSLSLLIWTACKKDSSSSSNASRTTLITQTTWRYDTSGIDLDHNGTIDLGNDTLIAKCQKDDIYTFASNGTGTMDEGSLKCSVADPQTSSFNWSLTNHDSVLHATFPPISGTINIQSVTSTKWTLYKDTTISGISIRYIVSLKH